MSIKPISTINYSDARGNDKKSCTSHVGKCIGLASGLALSGSLVRSQMKVLKTIRGKKELIDSFHYEGKSLNDFMPKVVNRDSTGKIIPYKDTVSDRTKAIVDSYKNELYCWGGIITAITTGMGYLADKSITAVNKKECASK